MQQFFFFIEFGTVDLVVHGDLHRSLGNTLKEGEKERPLMRLNILSLPILSSLKQQTD